MSILVVDQQVVHYEVFGHGRPVLFLHGWLGSWRYWFPTIERVAEHFRTYSFDFWGFGDTNRHASAAESIQSYSDQVIRFLDEAIESGDVWIASAAQVAAWWRQSTAIDE